ncbi:MAG: hypothetical protein A2W23_02995 [Planctomycetes bacterium RBG_16_43_13]|nr:MAG: hypothetical protein A2W23_02995 [Planctomycetes bacterium RBG_16_43_13]
MSRLYLAALIGIAAQLLIASCGGGEDDSDYNPPPPTYIAPDTVASISGEILFNGTPPTPKPISTEGNPECRGIHKDILYDESILVKDAHLQNVFVYIKEGLENYVFAIPREPITISNYKCLFSPRVVGAQARQHILLLNNDPTTHNFHFHSKNSEPINRALPFQGAKYQAKITKSEVMIPIMCDLHPWMTGYIGVLQHPYFYVTGADGRFELKNIPAGEYTIETWHEKLGTQQQKIILAPNKNQKVVFTYPK